MKKCELSEKNQERFSWLMDAETHDEDVEIKRGVLYWKNGVWESGTWKGTENLNNWWIKELLTGTSENRVHWCGVWLNGLWKNGTWDGGRWLNGTWENGLWEHGKWFDGLWKNGTWLKNGTENVLHNRFSEKDYWENGTWENGMWLNGTWKNGLWLNGIKRKVLI